MAAEFLSVLSHSFDRYLMHGGYLTAINDMESGGSIRPSTFATYCDWIRGDMLKRGKQERYLREVLSSIITRYGSQITWNSLSRDLSIAHPATIAEYIQLMVRMDAVITQYALREDRLRAAPKKSRKVYLADPFIFHAVRSWLKPARDPFNELVKPFFSKPEAKGILVESCVVSHYNRFYPTYYIKAEGEVDVAYVEKGRFHPLEVKWTAQIRPKDLKQLAKYPEAKIISQLAEDRSLYGIPNEYLPLALLRLGVSPFRLRDFGV